MRSRALAGLVGTLVLLGTVVTGLPAGIQGAAATPLISRPVVWVSGQDAGKVFITQGTSILVTFDFLHGTSTNGTTVPVIGNGVASPKPHLIEFSPDGKFAYVSFQGALPTPSGCTCVAIIDTQTRSVVTTLTIPGQAVKTTQAKSSPDGTFVIVTQVGLNGTGPTNQGTITRFAVDRTTNPPTWTFVRQITTAPEFGPACTEFSNGTSGTMYVDSSLSTHLGVLYVDPTLTGGVTAFHPTDGDPQCGMHDPISIGGAPVVLVTDSGTPLGGANPHLGHIHLINTNTDAFTEASFSPFFAKNLHDNWSVQQEPIGAKTSDAASIVYGSDRDSDVLKRIDMNTGTISDLTMLPPVIPAGSNNCVAADGVDSPPKCGRGAIDTLDGSGDTVFAAMKETGDLAIVDGFSTQTFLHLVDPVASCSTKGDPNFKKCFTVHAVRVQPTLKTQVTGARTGALVVSSGQNVDVINASIPGGVIVQPGGSVSIENSTIGSLSSNGAVTVKMCKSTSAGSVSVTNSTGFVLIGDTGDDSCSPNTINGSLSLRNNTGGLDAVDNKVSGGILITGNSGSGPFGDDTSPEVSGNHH